MVSEVLYINIKKTTKKSAKRSSVLFLGTADVKWANSVITVIYFLIISIASNLIKYFLTLFSFPKFS
jgi:hypothetical protein